MPFAQAHECTGIVTARFAMGLDRVGVDHCGYLVGGIYHQRPVGLERDRGAGVFVGGEFSGGGGVAHSLHRGQKCGGAGADCLRRAGAAAVSIFWVADFYSGGAVWAMYANRVLAI